MARGRTLRLRVTVVASLGITAAIVLGLVLFYLLQVKSVRRTIDSQLRIYTIQIAQSANRGRWPKVLPASTSDANAQAQVIGANGQVLAATRSLLGVPATYALPAGSSTPVRLRAADSIIPGEVRVVGVHELIAGQPVTIIAGTSTGFLTQLRSTFATEVLVGFPIILLAAASAVWLIVGRALRPVEQITHAVTDITSADLAQRVPEPGTPDEIGELARTMNDMLARLEGSARQQRRFVADASHELRSPLAAIRTTLEVGLAHPDDAPWPIIAARAAQQTNRLEDLVQQLLDLAKADERILTIHAAELDVAHLLRELTATSAPHDVAIDLELAEPVITVGDSNHLSRLFRNVIDNAVRHAVSTVTITASGSTGRIVVEVADDGPGVPEADRDRIFERFVRLDTSRDRGTGTAGLGLAIAREIVIAHNGGISVNTNPPTGARFIIWLPQVTDSTASTPAAER